MMKQETNKQMVMQNIKISQIVDSLIDFRDKEEEKKDKRSEEFEQLKQTIKEKGVISPIHVFVTPTGQYALVDGRRRYLASKQLGLKEIPAMILEGRNEKELAVITLIQNIHRKNLSVIENARGLIALMELNGISREEVILNAKRLHKYKDQATVRGLNPKFMEIYESLGFSANYVYLFAELIGSVTEEVLDIIQEKNMSIDKARLLTHTKLREHPQIQKQLVDEIQDHKASNARIIVQDKIKDLETGALTKDDDGQYFYRDTVREQNKPEVEKHPLQLYLDLMEDSNTMLKALTGHILTKGEYKYTDKTITYSKDFRKKIVDDLRKRDAINLTENLELVKMAIEEMIESIRQKFPF